MIFKRTGKKFMGLKNVKSKSGSRKCPKMQKCCLKKFVKQNCYEYETLLILKIKLDFPNMEITVKTKMLFEI